jgi:hypothetical protein
VKALPTSIKRPFPSAVALPDSLSMLKMVSDFYYTTAFPWLGDSEEWKFRQELLFLVSSDAPLAEDGVTALTVFYNIPELYWTLSS